MTPGVFLSIVLVGLVAGTPIRRQDDDGNFGYEYGVNHPSGSSRVRVRTGNNHGNSYRTNFQPNADYTSEASYVNPHYVDPYYQPNRYRSYPTSYDRSPYSVQANLGYTSPGFAHQTNFDDSLLNYPQNKIEQVSYDPKPTFGLVQQEYEPQLSIDQQVLIEETPVISQETLVDKPLLSQTIEDVPPPKIIVQEPVNPIVQQSSVDISPHIGDSFVAQVPLDNRPNVLHRVGVPVIQDTIDKYPSQVKFGGQSKYQLVPFGPPYEKISHSTEIIHGPPRSYYSQPPPPPITKSVIPAVYPQQQEHIEVPLAPPVTVKLPPPPVTKSVAPVILPQQQEYLEEPLTPLVSVKLPPPPVTKSVVPVVLSQQQEHVEEPLIPPVSIKIPPPPVTKSVAPVLIPQQEHIEEPIIQPVSIKLPPPPVIKSVTPVVLSQQQEYVDEQLALPISIKTPPVTKSVSPVVVQQQQVHIEEPFIQPVAVKLPPAPVTKSVVALPQQQEHIDELLPLSIKLPPPPISQSVEPVVLSQQQEHVDEPIISQISVKIPPPPVTKTVVPTVVEQQQEYVEEPLHSPISVKLPPPPVTKSITPVIISDAQEHIEEPIYPSVKTFHPPPVTKSVIPPTYHSVKRPPIYNPPLRKHFRNIKAPPNAPPYSVKRPYARSYHVKTPYVSKPPLTYAPIVKSPIPYSVKQPYIPNTSYHYGNPHIKSRVPITKSAPVSYSVKNPVVSNIHSVKQPKAVKGYPHVKAPLPPPILSQASYVAEPLPPSPHSIKTPIKTVSAPSKPKYLPVGHSPAIPPPDIDHTAIDLDVPQETPYPVEENIPLPPVSHSFPIQPVVTPVEPLPSIVENKGLFPVIEPVVAIPLDTPPAPVSHSIRLPLSPLPKTTQVPNLFKSVPSLPDGLISSTDLASSEKNAASHSVVLPLPVTEPKVSALRSDVLSSPVSHSVRLGAPRYRETYGEPKKDFPAFPAASAYEYPDPVSDRVNKEIGGNFGERINGRTRL